ncbi:Proline--tRNA ligase [Rickettsiales endosymbiont of Paramecium tredecaurelia]|uniref:proline--tRNA ligase n=1 Tax=Candidatus Sarmatiella mevalonica TaxID=2770581 RepID=UPI0019244422|nr:proline--tRNA ligase [Candidatus Sarmatiella mevalonica]MBL3284447.1 Proline--tRNA ligase [Candidatus Sarmatiella mevalonica]
MLLSKYFLPTSKEKPLEAHVTSHSLMLRAGMITQQSAGIYSWLPMGLRVLQKISNIVRDNMNQCSLEILMPCIQSADLWIESGRYDDYGKEMLRIQDRHEHAMLFGPTHEEMVTDIFRKYVKSYKELPKNFYQIQWKFRDEIRPRFGLMRGREFCMKDAYSFDLTPDDARATYNQMLVAYLKTFADLGVYAIPVMADSGPIGGDLSHEFHIVSNSGESDLFYDERFDELMQNPVMNLELLKSLYAAADERHESSKVPAGVKLKNTKGIEVGHIFYFGDKYSKSMHAAVQNQSGELVNVYMGSYGIGVSRLVAAIIESSHDQHGIVWPMSVAPFHVSLINLDPEDEATSREADNLYQDMLHLGLEVLYDDTHKSVGAKLATHDLIGIPYHVIIGKRGLQQGVMELKVRASGKRDELKCERHLAQEIKRVIDEGAR